MTDGPQKFFLTCSECAERVLIEIPEDPQLRQERSAQCSRGHAIHFDERTVLGSEEPVEEVVAKD